MWRKRRTEVDEDGKDCRSGEEAGQEEDEEEIGGRGARVKEDLRGTALASLQSSSSIDGC